MQADWLTGRHTRNAYTLFLCFKIFQVCDWVCACVSVYVYAWILSSSPYNYSSIHKFRLLAHSIVCCFFFFHFLFFNVCEMQKTMLWMLCSLCMCIANTLWAQYTHTTGTGTEWSGVCRGVSVLPVCNNQFVCDTHRVWMVLSEWVWTNTKMENKYCDTQMCDWL